MNGDTKDNLVLQIKAFVVFHFLNKYTSIERLVTDIFTISISSFSEINKRRLHYYYGARIATYNDGDQDIIKLREVKFDIKEEFKDFKALQILKIDKQFKMIDDFSFEIESFQTREKLDFRSCMTKIVKMRNKLAHELVQCKFTNQEIIETLSNENIRKYGEVYLLGNSVTCLDNMTKEIIGNLIYMSQMEEKLTIIKTEKYNDMKEV